jgi:uncharacterized membrane protein (UPF0127 family)
MALAACGSGGGGSSGSGATGPAATHDTAVVLPEGFSAVGVTLTEPDGSVCQTCMLLAADPAQRERGLMEATTLGGYDGMVFSYDSPIRGAYWMKNTVMPLSIAFFDGDGTFMTDFDMDPCTSDPCPTYGPGAAFRYTVEVPRGALADVGAVAGSTIELGLPCQPLRTG